MGLLYLAYYKSVVTRIVSSFEGLFNTNHMQYHLKSNKSKEPTLEEMTRFAISSLQKNPNGYFLFVEGK
jgi:alkaline phosphatase